MDQHDVAKGLGADVERQLMALAQPGMRTDGYLRMMGQIVCATERQTQELKERVGLLRAKVRSLEEILYKLAE